ncbi:hypothetical protein Pcinc_016911 [Petrolisthes cinctipes]|uniref:Apple domain-containing protein n=1 Tax=Petrolisthes cinctipes TaxID=88211 RepID=A0AAE1KP99_PETCI|nr:hypothetical protein Pcinc_016911 [Petrolisthes cinctipes]
MKYDAEVVGVFKVSMMACAALCEASSTCKSYNYKGVTECQMLDWRPTAPTKDGDPKLVVATGWSFFNVHPPPLPDAGDVCPLGFAVVRYDQPGNLKYDFNIDGYTCVNKIYITTEISNGKTGGMPISCTLLKQTHTTFPPAAKTHTPGVNYWYVYCTEP